MAKNDADAWKRRAWQAVSAMHTAEMCRTVDDMRKTLREARMGLEAFFVRDQNEASMARRIEDTEDQTEEGLEALYTDDT